MLVHRISYDIGFTLTFLRQGQIWENVSIRISRFRPKIGIYSFRNEYMKICENKRSRSLFTFESGLS